LVTIESLRVSIAAPGLRDVADRERIDAFVIALARHATADVDVVLVGRVTYRHFDFVAQALAKIERGHARELADVHAIHAHGLIGAASVRAQFALMEPELFRFPAIDPPSRARVPLDEAISILRDVARALAHAHGEGVVQRDIKPDNMLLSGGAAVVTDFGIAKAISAARTFDGQPPRSEQATLTQVGSSIGPPGRPRPGPVARLRSARTPTDITRLPGEKIVT